MQKTILAALATAWLLTACNDATEIGSGLVDGTQLPISITDTTAFEMNTRAPNTRLSDNILTDEVVSVGCIEDATFGRQSSALGVELVELTRFRGIVDALQVDSVVLVLPVIPEGQIGDTTAPTELRVRGAAVGSIRLDEATLDDDIESTDVVFGTYSGLVPRDSVTVTTPSADTLIVERVAPQIRVRLETMAVLDALRPALARVTPADTVVNDSSFVERFGGIIIDGGSACAKTLPALSLRPSDVRQFGISVYYKEGGLARQLRFINRRTNAEANAFGAGQRQGLRANYAVDYGTSVVADLVARGISADSFAALQGLNGLNIEVRIPELRTFGERRGVTFAELIVPLAPSVDSATDAPPRVLIQVEDADGKLKDYTAVPAAINTSGIYSAVEGGTLVKIEDPRGGVDSLDAYRFNITSLVQGFVSGNEDPTFFLVPSRSEQLAARVLLLGPGAGQLRARLRIASTVLP